MSDATSLATDSVLEEIVYEALPDQEQAMKTDQQHIVVDAAHLSQTMLEQVPHFFWRCFVSFLSNFFF